MKLRVEPLSDSDLTLSPLVLPSRFVADRFRTSFDPQGSNVNLIGPETASRLVTSLEVVEEPSEEPLVDVRSIPAEHVKSPVGSGLDERPENENLEGFPNKDDLEMGNTLIREEETENENDRIEETSLPRPAEEETTYEAGDTNVPPPPAVDYLIPISTRVEDPTAAATKETASRLVTSLEVVEEPSEEPLVDVTSIPTEHVKSPVGSGLDERPENENLERFPGKDDLEMGDTLVREEETENVGIEDPVLVSDSSSEGREDEEKESDGIEETSLPRPAEEETTYEAGDTNVAPPPVVDSLVPISTQVEDPTAAATKGPDDQDYVP
ncbi:hypothetical protein F2Q68_00008796 [Brassica cretica]|uniref:Uncharacterized protein n=1 Tax=Brassica cretica TaxID=69181 RepID=A0A8S9KPQ6_BRACR|nr:hypothetical protein F2Q68_00008796 [Brassica cretica]